ncbi:bifunctional riboflavin kinase/FAD synthetase [Lyngbya sp. CCY1209]|uniref:bifunctional riboflavin kinase/FAD synthetase n=1 Tax=Lyngbya sp. CCY1209 TaxID=2886103 RepID=UPI002D20A29A|nr:bifunctional riboflavin kinase/FAD synthetase [Lyngbya sp. CCY1209]MEB3883928.1 bifunctional riboflavin kinase/FAD synthetase [Lyngbya sp. CCY1209]
MWITSSTDTVLTPTTVALGNFDGFHRGHQQVVQPILNPRRVAVDSPRAARQASGPPGPTAEVPPGLLPIAQHIYSTVVTFNPHPQEFFTGQPKKLLTPLDEKVEVLRAFGVDQLVLLPFDRQLASLTPTEFVEEILVRRLRAGRVSVGFDFRFGRGRTGSTEDLKAIAPRYGLEVHIVSRHPCENGERISSSMIRTALERGDPQRAAHLLGRPYLLAGQVMRGQQLGRTLGFPTANLQLPADKFLPRYGVYAVRVAGVSGSVGDAPSPKIGVMNVGSRPTVAGAPHPTVEVHLLDWGGDLYGRTLTVSLEAFLRPERKFASLDALKAQIEADCIEARSVLGEAKVPEEK